MYSEVDYREDIMNFLAESNMQFTDKVVDIMVGELATKIENHEFSGKKVVSRESKIYQKFLTESVSSVVKRFKKVNFDRDNFALEDDYSEESFPEL